jgi:glutamate formiminotransferase
MKFGVTTYLWSADFGAAQLSLLPRVKALGFELVSRGLVQVSMNLTDYQRTTIARAFAAVSSEATNLGVEVCGAEIVGLLPRAALDRSADYFPLLENFQETLLLENLLESRKASGT